MSISGKDISNPGYQSLENYFSNSIVPQLFVDSEMMLRSFTSPAAEIFAISQEDIGKSLYNLKDKIAHNALIDNIRGVLLVEKNKEKEIQTLNGRVFNMNVQPFFGNQNEPIIGVIVTYLELTGKSEMKKLENLNSQKNSEEKDRLQDTLRQKLYTFYR